jgi:flagellar biosynthesis protein FlhG
MTRKITITSGKGGVGKTNIGLNLALQLSKLGQRVCLFDADLGLANINILLGIHPQFDMKDAIIDRLPIRDIIIKNHEGIDIFPGSSGVEEIANLPAEQTEALLKSFSGIGEYDFFLFDTSAGISKNVISFCLASPEVLVILTPEPTSLTDAFALIKVLSQNGFQGVVKVIVNQCKNSEIAKKVYEKFSAAVQKYIDIKLSALGVIFHDSKVTEAVKQQRPFLSLYPNTRASRCIGKMAERLLSDSSHFSGDSDMFSFWGRFFQLFKTPVTLPKRESTSDQPKPPKGSALTEQSVRAEPSVSNLTEVIPGSPALEDSSPHTTTDKREAPPSEAVTQTSDILLNVEHSVLPVFEKLIESISSVSKELQLLRQEVKGNGNAMTNLEIRRSKDHDASENEPIILDLEAFLKGRSQNRKEPS